MLYGSAQDNALMERIIGCAINVHRELGPGLLESVYETALCCELRDAGLAYRRQEGVPLYYKGELISEHRPDLVVNDRVVVEVKSAKCIERIYVAQVLTYLRVLNLKLGLILNFNSVVMRHGVRRVMN